MFINRNKKPGLVRAQDNLTVWSIILTIVILFTYLKMQKVRENYQGLHDDHGELKRYVNEVGRRVSILEAK